MAKRIVPLRDRPQHGDTESAELNPAPRPAWMSDTEARLYDELVNTTRKLAARGVPVSYSVIADVADAMERAQNEGRSSLREIATGLDKVRHAARQHRADLVAHRKGVFSVEDNQLYTFFACLAGLASIGCALAGIGEPTWLYLSAFWAAVASALLLPVVFSLRNR